MKKSWMQLPTSLDILSVYMDDRHCWMWRRHGLYEVQYLPMCHYHWTHQGDLCSWKNFVLIHYCKVPPLLSQQPRLLLQITVVYFYFDFNIPKMIIVWIKCQFLFISGSWFITRTIDINFIIAFFTFFTLFLILCYPNIFIN